MRWRNRRQSGNVEDRRGSGSGRIAVGGIGTIVIAIIIWLLGGNPLEFIESGNVSNTEIESAEIPENDTLAQYVAVVLAETEDVWDSIFSASGERYRQPKLVLFRNTIQSACGYASDASGPFYCPGDEKVYIDLGFFDEMQTRFGATGDFAFAYVIAHEIGHHVQKQLGVLEKAQEMKSGKSEKEANKVQVKVELQADFYAGIWAYHIAKYKKIIEDGDAEEALNAANAVGDDRLQRQYQGTVVPDAFTHGTSRQRMEWFMRGFKTGNIELGNTFENESL
ncbi:MAG: zinc metallopeptidase [Bacteroidales bacterium]|nr:zinc metallopeptidase [Bacteroidales bacterium]